MIIPSSCRNLAKIFPVLFIYSIAALGGSSRVDNLQMPLVGVICAVSVSLCLWNFNKKKIESDRYLNIILLVFSLYVLFQLIAPINLLPPFSEGALLRNAEFDLLEGGYLNLSISRHGGLNSLVALLPIAATLMILCRMHEVRLIGLVRVFVAIALFSAIIGILQIYHVPSSILYFYEITNKGSAVGIFANRNHHAVFLVCSMQFLFFFMNKYRLEGIVKKQWVVVAAINLFLVLLFIIGSRAGFILAGGILIYNMILFHTRKSVAQSRKVVSRFAVGSMLAGSSAAFFCLFLFNDRIPALSRLVASDPVSELRAQALPVFIEMARNNMPFGVGFGGFEAAYKMMEPYELMGPNYLNHAHNDWVQFIIEGGLVGGVILLFLVAMIAKAGLRLFRHAAPYCEEIEIAKSAFVVLVVIALASFADYPLRTPFFAVFATWCTYLTMRVSTAIGDQSRFANLRAIP